MALASSSELAQLNKRQKSREQESASRLKQAGVPRTGSRDGHAIPLDDVYRRETNVTHMPDVVSKVT